MIAVFVLVNAFVRVVSFPPSPLRSSHSHTIHAHTHTQCGGLTNKTPRTHIAAETAHTVTRTLSPSARRHRRGDNKVRRLSPSGAPLPRAVLLMRPPWLTTVLGTGGSGGQPARFSARAHAHKRALAARHGPRPHMLPVVASSFAALSASALRSRAYVPASEKRQIARRKSGRTVVASRGEARVRRGGAYAGATAADTRRASDGTC